MEKYNNIEDFCESIFNHGWNGEMQYVAYIARKYFFVGTEEELSNKKYVPIWYIYGDLKPLNKEDRVKNVLRIMNSYWEFIPK